MTAMRKDTPLLQKKTMRKKQEVEIFRDHSSDFEPLADRPLNWFRLSVSWYVECKLSMLCSLSQMFHISDLHCAAHMTRKQRITLVEVFEVSVESIVEILLFCCPTDHHFWIWLDVVESFFASNRISGAEKRRGVAGTQTCRISADKSGPLSDVPYNAVMSHVEMANLEAISITWYSTTKKGLQILEGALEGALDGAQAEASDTNVHILRDILDNAIQEILALHQLQSQ